MILMFQSFSFLCMDIIFRRNYSMIFPQTGRRLISLQFPHLLQGILSPSLQEYPLMSFLGAIPTQKQSEISETLLDLQIQTTSALGKYLIFVDLHVNKTFQLAPGVQNSRNKVTFRVLKTPGERLRAAPRRRAGGPLRSQCLRCRLPPRRASLRGRASGRVG